MNEALHSVIVSSQLMSMLPVNGPAIIRAISRWYELWEMTKSRMDPEEFRKSGLLRHLGGLAWLAHRMLELQLSGARQAATSTRSVGSASVAELHHLVRLCHEG